MRPGVYPSIAPLMGPRGTLLAFLVPNAMLMRFQTSVSSAFVPNLLVSIAFVIRFLDYVGMVDSKCPSCVTRKGGFTCRKGTLYDS